MIRRKGEQRDAWMPDSPECELVFQDGISWPVAIVVTRYESNHLGERRLIDSKTLAVSQPKEAA